MSSRYRHHVDLTELGALIFLTCLGILCLAGAGNIVMETVQTCS